MGRVVVKRIVLLSLLAGCLRSTEYHCMDSSQCSGGTCQPVGFCSFADTTCTTGQRFGDSAGSYASACVGDGTDAGVTDGMGSDTLPPDTGGGACPGTYAAIMGGQGNHVYRVVMGTDDWDTQRAACAADGANAYLVIPDDATELAAVANRFSGQTQTFWVGITDAATEGTFLTVKGAAATFLPWQGGQPDNSGNSDCVETNRTQHTYNDRTCGTQERAMCECEP
ncbi:MAG TPA: C-type lectin domain-containing protein [Kofleriaceae bacterium]|jgi:hypothetical protein